MFIVAVLVLAWSLGGWWVKVPNPFALAAQVPPDLGQWFTEMSRGEEETEFTRERLEKFLETPFFHKVDEYLRLHLLRLALSAFCMLSVVIVAILIYILRALRDRRLSAPLRDLASRKEILSLAALAGISPPRVSCKPGFLNGLAFGPKGKEVLLLEGHPKILNRPWPATLRAVALHEMAHIANGDIRTREVSRSAWQALLAVLGFNLLAIAIVSFTLHGNFRLPLVLPTILHSEVTPQPLWVHGVKVAGVLCLLAWLWASLIRSREFYADARVVTWNYREALALRLRLRDLFRSRCWRLHLHPSHEQRLALLASPRRLFRVSVGITFITGLLVALTGVHLAPVAFDGFLVVAPIHGALLMVVGPISHLLLLPLILIPIGSVSHLLTRALGVQVQREAVADLAMRPHHDWGYLRQFAPAAWFALGLEVGIQLAPLDLFSPAWTPMRLVLALGPVTLVVWLWLVLLRAASRLFLGMADTEQGWHRWQKRLRLGSALLLGMLLWPLLLVRLSLEGATLFEWTLPLAVPDLAPVEVFVMILLSAAFSGLALGLVFLLIATVGILVTAIWRYWFHHPLCPQCRTCQPSTLLVGRICPACGEPLTPWFLRLKAKVVLP